MKTDNCTASTTITASTSTRTALISNDDLFKFFNLERDNVQSVSVTHKSDGVYVNITLNRSYCQCPVCGNMTSKIKDYREKKTIEKRK